MADVPMTGAGGLNSEPVPVDYRPIQPESQPHLNQPS